MRRPLKYIDAIEGSAMALVLSIIAIWLIPAIEGSSSEIEILLTVSTFLFAILAGFFISRLNSRYNEIREITANEDAYWLVLAKTVPLYGKKLTKKIYNLIDLYYIHCFDVQIATNYKSTAKYFLEIFDELKKYKKHKNDSVFGQIFAFLGSIEESRNKASILSLERISVGQWGVLISLASIITYCIFCLRTDELHSKIITVMLTTILVLVILIIRDLQNLMFGGETLAVESGQEVLIYIGKERYYNKKYIDDGSVKIPKHVKRYRLGYHKPDEKPKIKIVNVKS